MGFKCVEIYMVPQFIFHEALILEGPPTIFLNSKLSLRVLSCLDLNFQPSFPGSELTAYLKGSDVFLTRQLIPARSFNSRV